MMAAGTSMRVGTAQAAAAKPAGTAAAPGGNFQSLLSTAPAAGSAEAAVEPHVNADQGADGEAAPEPARDGIAELLAGLLTGIAATPAGGDGAGGEEGTGEGEAEGAALVEAAADEFLLTQAEVAAGTASQEEGLLAAASADADASLDDPIDAMLPQLSAVARDVPVTAASDPALSSRNAIGGAGELLRVLDAGSGITPVASAAIHAPNAASPLASNATPGPELRSALGTPRWADELGSRIVLMTARGQQEGSLSLTPEHLGPVEVRISVIHNTASVWFSAQHADTRAALAEAMPRLREMFSDAGLALGQADVSHQPPRRHAAEARGTDPSMRGDARAVEAAAPPAMARVVSSALLDLYA